MSTLDEYKQAIQANQTSNAHLYSNPKSDFESAMIRLTDTSPELEDFENYLRQRRKGSNGKYIKLGDPLMNENGINSILAIMDSLANKHSIMGYSDRKDIDRHIDFLADNLAKILMINRHSYNITSTTRNIIFQKCIVLGYQILQRGLNEGDRRFWKGSVQEIKTTVDNHQPKGGLFSSINPFKR